MAVTDEIEHGGLEAMAALTKVRTAARQALLQPCPAPAGSWFNLARSHAATEAARRFYHDTTIFNLDTITGTGSATPAITGTPGTVPHAAAAPQHRSTAAPGHQPHLAARQRPQHPGHTAPHRPGHATGNERTVNPR
jgi:hypothetical protein